MFASSDVGLLVWSKFELCFWVELVLHHYLTSGRVVILFAVCKFLLNKRIEE